MLGPVMSTSRMPTLYPSMVSASARFEETVDLPTPPLPEITMTTCLILDRVFCSFVWSSISSALSTGADISYLSSRNPQMTI